MSKKKHRKIWEEQSVNTDAVSNTEYTGLMPAVPEDEAERDSYNELYDTIPEPEKWRD